jgi:PleD family two-component response regulator
MPEMNGWMVFDKIHDVEAFKFIPIMFFTTLDEEDAKEKVFKIGAYDHITKPCQKTILLDKIKDTLHKAELQKEQRCA